MSPELPARRLCVAPMMDRTDRHFRFLTRLLAPNAWLYTEMVTTGALIWGEPGRHLCFDESEHPVALQLGGNDPAELAACARLGEAAGFDEINLNAGCPSSRVQSGAFGAILMREPEVVARAVAAIRNEVACPVTVKTRLGVDNDDSYEFLMNFLAPAVAAGCRTIILHARKAWLKGLSPKENREIPPLDYARVAAVKQEFPDIEIILNGGLTTADAVLEQLDCVDGVMVGRAAYNNPMLLADLDARLFGSLLPVREKIIDLYVDYMEQQVAGGQKLRFMCRHLLGLYAGMPGGRRWRRFLGELPEGEAGIAALRRYLEQGVAEGHAGNGGCAA